MGQGQQKPTINPNAPQTSNQPPTYNQAQQQVQQQAQYNSNQNSISPKDQRFMGYIRQALRNCSSSGYLNKDGFNQVLAVLQNMGFKRLRDTPLADRLFNVLDVSRTGSIEERQFGKAIAEIVGDRNTALMYTFKVFDSDRDNRISKKEFMQLIQDSWRAAFRILAQKCDGKQFGQLTIRDLQSWANSKVQNINQQSSKLFNKLDTIHSGFIQFQAFKEFVANGGYNDITACINMEKVIVPLNLTTLYAQ